MATPVVLHVLEALEGGTARHLVDLVRTVDDVRHEVAIPARRSEGVTDVAAAPAIEAAGGHVHLVGMRRLPVHPANARALADLAGLVGRLRPAIIHGHSSIGGALARTVPRRGAAVVYTPNGIAAGRGALTVERLLARRADRFIAVSRSEAEHAVNHRLAAPGAIRVIPNGIDLTAPPPLDPSLRTRLGIGARVPLIGTIARLVPQKAPEVFVAACAAVGEVRPDVHFVLVGSGRLQAEVDAEVVRGRLDGRFHQVRDLPEAARAVGELDVFVMTSRFEGGPYAPLEAMRARVPVVLTDVVGNRDVVIDGDTGLLAPADDPRTVGAKVLALLGDHDLAQRLVDRAAGRLAQVFDIDVMARSTADVYRELAWT